jgi:hypothetical protein
VSDFGEVIKQEERFAALYDSYSEAMKAFLALPIPKKKARKEALHALQTCATAFFNSFERLVVFGSLSGAANDKVWYRDKAETALNLLEIIHHHYKAAFARAEELGVIVKRSRRPRRCGNGTWLARRRASCTSN